MVQYITVQYSTARYSTVQYYKHFTKQHYRSSFPTQNVTKQSTQCLLENFLRVALNYDLSFFRIVGLGGKLLKINPLQPSGHYMYRQFNTLKFHVLPTQCIYVLCVDLRTNSDYFPVQH